MSPPLEISSRLCTPMPKSNHNGQIDVGNWPGQLPIWGLLVMMEKTRVSIQLFIKHFIAIFQYTEKWQSIRYTNINATNKMNKTDYRSSLQLKA